MTTPRTDKLVCNLLALNQSAASDFLELVRHAENLERELAAWQTCAESLAEHIRPESERRCSALIHFDSLKTVAAMPNGQKLSHGGKNRRPRQRNRQRESPLAPALC
jgi:hypothetical protein